MSTIPTLTEQKIRTFVGEHNFQKGQQLVRYGAIVHSEQQAMALKAYCYGSLPEPYRVQLTFDGTGITAALCSCSTGTPAYGNRGCEHAAAVLLAWSEQPETFTQTDGIDTILERQSRTQLITLIKQLLQKQPEVEWQLTMPPLPGHKNVPIDIEQYRDQVDEAFQHTSHQWDAVYGISHALYQVTATAARFAQQRDYANAAAIYEVVALQTLTHYLSYHDEDGALGRVVQECVEGLGACLELEAAEAVGFTQGETTAGEVILTLAALVDASLIQTETVVGGVIRFQMLELVRDYALQRLHAAYYARLAETVFAHFGPEPGVREAHFVFAMTQELPNARAALQWVEERQEAELGLRLTGFARLWHIRGQMREAERWMEHMLALDLRARDQGEPTASLPLRIQLLYGIGRPMVRHGKVEPRAEVAANEALQLAQQIGDESGISNAYATLGMIAQAGGKLDEAEAAYMESATHARMIEHRGLLSAALFHLGELAGIRGELGRATVLLEEAQALAQAVGMTWYIPIYMTLLGHLVCQQQNYPLAKTRYREALALYRAFGSPTYIAACLDGYTAAACAEGHYVQATRLCGAAAALREQTQTELLPAQREAFEQVVATARAALDEPTFEREWNIGTTLTQDEAIDDVLSD